MKKLMTLVLLSTSTALASSDPLISTGFGGGYTSPEHQRYEKCDIYADKVVITKQLGQDSSALTLVETRSISLTGDIAANIKGAATEKVTQTPNNLCDGPMRLTHATLGSLDVLLFDSGACGSPQKVRNGLYTERLKTIVTTYCNY